MTPRVSVFAAVIRAELVARDGLDGYRETDVLGVYHPPLGAPVVELPRVSSGTQPRGSTL